MRKEHIPAVLLLTAIALSAGCGKETRAKAETETLQSEAAETEMVADITSEPETLETETEDNEDLWDAGECDTQEKTDDEEFPEYLLNDKKLVSKARKYLNYETEEENKISISAEERALYIDGEKYPLSENACDESDVFFLGDVDISDSTVEIFVPETISGWITPVIGIYRFENKELKYLGNLNESREGWNLYFDGMNHIYLADFRVHIPVDLDVIAEFTINENEELELMNPEEGFPYKSANEEYYKYILQQNLQVYADRDLSLEPYDIKPQKVSIVRTDARNWIQVIGEEDGTSGWLYVEKTVPEETKEYATREWLYWEQDSRPSCYVPEVGKIAEDIFEGMWENQP